MGKKKKNVSTGAAIFEDYNETGKTGLKRKQSTHFPKYSRPQYSITGNKRCRCWTGMNQLLRLEEQRRLKPQHTCD